MRGLGIAVFLLAMLPLIFGGKIYNTLKRVMSFKIVTVLGFLLPGDLLLERRDLAGDRHRLLQVWHGAGGAG